MSYVSRELSIEEAIYLISQRVIADPEASLVMALKQGALIASGLYRLPETRKAEWGDLSKNWWRHFLKRIDNVVFFDDRQTVPPFAERVVIQFSDINRLWPGNQEYISTILKKDEEIVPTNVSQEPIHGKLENDQDNEINSRSKDKTKTQQDLSYQGQNIKRRGRPNGSGIKPHDAELVLKAIEKINSGDYTSDAQALNAVLDEHYSKENVLANVRRAAFDRLRRKISNRRTEHPEDFTSNTGQKPPIESN